MNYQGLQNALPLLFITALMFVILFTSWRSYSQYAPLSTPVKYFLSFLRAFSLTIVLVLLLNPFFSIKREIEVKPKIAVFLDNSESTSLIKGNYNGINSYSRVLKDIQGLENADIDLAYFAFGNSVSPSHPDSLSYKETVSNLYEVIDYISSGDDEYSSAILVSDGILNYGKQPLVRAGQSNIPIHTIALGDSSKLKDLAISNVYTNQTGFTNTRHSIEVELSQFGLSGNELSLSLYQNTEQLKDTSFTLNEQVSTLQFDIDLDEAGLKSYTISAQPLAGDIIKENNSYSFSIDVLESKTKILHVANGIHPDVKAIRSILLSDANIELSTITRLGSLPSKKNILNNSNSFDLIILHGSTNELDELNTVYHFDQSPTLYIHLPNDAIANQGAFYHLLTNNGPLFNVQLLIDETETSHPILELTEINLNRLAPIQASIRTRLNEVDVLTLLQSQYQGLETNAAILAIQERGNIRRSQLNASGWYKIYQSTNPAERSFLIELINNLVNWTSSNPDDRLLKVNPSKIDFTISEVPIINASLLNENGEIEANGNIEIQLSGVNYPSNSFNMANLGNGNYQLKTPNLPEGKYTFEAIAQKSNRVIESQKGEFIVTNSSKELNNTEQNTELLKSIAQLTRGEYFDFKDSDQLLQRLSERDNLTIKSETIEEFYFPVKSAYWFILVLILLGTEWFMRKKYSLP